MHIYVGVNWLDVGGCFLGRALAWHLKVIFAPLFLTGQVRTDFSGNEVEASACHV